MFRSQCLVNNHFFYKETYLFNTTYICFMYIHICYVIYSTNLFKNVTTICWSRELTLQWVEFNGNGSESGATNLTHERTLVLIAYSLDVFNGNKNISIFLGDLLASEPMQLFWQSLNKCRRKKFFFRKCELIMGITRNIYWLMSNQVRNDYRMAVIYCMYSILLKQTICSILSRCIVQYVDPYWTCMFHDVSWVTLNF